jgi:hypothetical protein
MTGMHTPEKYTSQSEAKKALDCGLAWFAEWWLGYRSGEESMPQRVGSLGHAYIAEHVTALHEQRTPSYTEALLAECKKRRYIQDNADGPITYDDRLHADIDAAADGAQVLLDSGVFQPHHVTIHRGAPMIEQRLQVPWRHLWAIAGLDTFKFPSAFHRHRAGMEGTPDIVHEPDASTLFCDDYKFRQKPDLGGTVDNPDPLVPDLQGAFYKLLMRGAGIGHGKEVIFRQLNVYAGRWLSVDDLLAEGSPYITEHGLPSVDLKTLGALIRPEDYETAWRALVERRRVASLSALTSTGRKKSVRMASEAETYTFGKFRDTLQRWPLVQVIPMRLDHSVCLDVVRDMLATVSALIVQADAGQVPGRHLRSYATSPCLRPHGCSIQAPCRAAIGTGNVQATLTEMASDGRLHLRATPGSIGDHPRCEPNNGRNNFLATSTPA